MHLVLNGEALLEAKTKDFSARGFGIVLTPQSPTENETNLNGAATASLWLGDRPVRIGGDLVRSEQRNGQVEAGFVVPEIIHPAAYGLLMRIAYTGEPTNFARWAHNGTSSQSFERLLAACETRFSERLLVQVEWAASRGGPVESFFNTLVKLRARKDDLARIRFPTQSTNSMDLEQLSQALFDAFDEPCLDTKTRSLLAQVTQEVVVENATV